MDKYQELLSNVIDQNKLPTLNYKAGDVLFHQGIVESKLFWIKSGLVKLVFIQPDGKEFVKAFLAENDLSGSLMSVVFHKPSPYACICIEACEVIAIPYKKIRDWSEKNPQLKDVELQFMQQLTARKEEREYQFLCLTPQQRYETFKVQYPHIFKRISQAELALFLGITPVALCRINARLQALVE
ncbi:Crp/Fnr family transcriptional regulator [Pseudoalteromonas denitrificans]|uniref:cAMP-binding domain of CRP or a regulatory subunit of cAMP-dependent protein kinases n=1 Tax=Pseudoalteromonas denitrificans DSM 6059 TaxID=1123010 RepID=A0A1I1L9N1_9GAMM|nr:Crp/Fnr family transcriptional regulator [Pseudoalteromonas denitrificans]SFC69719.1 cAMP-binding domain of CRP or a regulatory subunit of cAMP-dependent protein kinases [Pseudoalteromonas denitrificans DSM 6059]